LTTALLENTQRSALWSGALIDCDVHATVPRLDVLFPHMDPVWVEGIIEREWRGPVGPKLSYPPGAPTTVRDEWRREGVEPASELAFLQKDVLDPWSPDFAILNCYYGIDSVRHPDLAAALASAVNNWLIAEWLDKDTRLKGTLVIPARDPIAAAREIDRVGSHPGFVQIMLPVRTDRLYGQRYYNPIYEAAERHGLVVGLHWGGTADDSPSPTGFASWYVEEVAAETQLYLSHLTSMILEGTFSKFRNLRVSVMEGGFMWVPGWAWGVNKKWKGLRREVPWVDKLPFDILREHVRFSVAPAYMGPDEHSARHIEWLGADNLLMFATDYPHRHDDSIEQLLRVVPEQHQAGMMAETARGWYRL
jgi:predicted TIM-barrel fold metal-dependent hydrolase